MNQSVARPLALPLRPLFTATILLGSFLLFLIQPMFGRSVLPLLGGAPSVWNTAMLFYQVTLLLGYLYAHAVRRLSLKRQLALHLALFAVAALTLPISVANWLPAGDAMPPVLWLLGLLAASIGPVFFVASAQSPLMQSWFARSDDPAAANPYFLYAASNIGSFAALIAYPLLVEPNIRLGDQSLLWSAGFVLLAALVAICGLSVIRNGAAAAAVEPEPVAVTWAQRGRWTLLAFVASALLLSTTTHLTTDIMAMPLLWVIPLGVYLLSFIIAFGSFGEPATRWACRLTPFVLLLGGSWSFLTLGPQIGVILAVAGIVLLFVIALALHGTLAAERPPAGALTDFYLWISVGGALGGVLCALIAPVVFDWPFEHPILLIVAAALVPGVPMGPRSVRLWANRRVRIGGAVLALLLSAGVGYVLRDGVVAAAGRGVAQWLLAALLLLWLLAIVAIGQRRLFAFVFAMLMLSLSGWQQLQVSAIEGARHRSFFGVYTVETDKDRNVRTLKHGTTLHGLESLDPGKARAPQTYYAPLSGVGRAMAAAPALFGSQARIGYVGLGAGTLTCYARPGQNWIAYEIDPVIADIARNQFQYIAGCRPDLPVVVGDARLTLAKAPRAGLDILAVDAFSSDSIPLHMVTREALRVFGGALQPDGVLLIHITNQFLDLEPVIAAVAGVEGWTARALTYRPGKQPRGQAFTQSTWVALSRNPERMATFTAAAGGPEWQPLRSRADVPAWSDDFASILPVLRWRK